MVVNDDSKVKPKKRKSDKDTTQKQIKLKNPVKRSTAFSSGGGGNRYETQVLALFATLMFTKGVCPVSNRNISKVIPQTGDNHHTDDIKVVVEDSLGKSELLCSVKYKVSITKNNSDFSNFIKSAWYDYNSDSFQKDKDRVVLVTGPLTRNGREIIPLLKSVRMHRDSNTFLTNLNTRDRTSENKRKIHGLLCELITEANGGNVLKNEEIHEFLRHIHIIDLDLSPNGVNEALVLSHLSTYCEDPKTVWSVIYDYAEEHKVAGVEITQRIPQALRVHFSKFISVFPELLEGKYDEILFNPDNIEALAIMWLIGGWDSRGDKWPGDLEAIREFTREIYTGGFPEWEKKIKHIRFLDVSPVTLENGAWFFKDRESSLKILKGVFDNTLDAFLKLVLDITSERDPALDLPSDKRLVAQVYAKNRKFSPVLRKSVLEGFAILANNTDMLPNCSDLKKNTFSDKIVNSIMESITWEDFCSLNGLLQPIAEASPKVFLNSLENTINRNPQLFNRVQKESNTGFMGINYIQDLLWALEALAWDPTFLSDVTSVLGQLAKTYENLTGSGPFDSLIRIFLPWRPNTMATVEERFKAVKVLCNENPDVARKLIFNIRPEVQTISFETMKPKWRTTVEVLPQTEVSSEEYQSQIDLYTSLAVKMGENDPIKMIDTIQKMHNIPADVFERFADATFQAYVITSDSKTKIDIFTRLLILLSKNRLHSNASWAMNEEYLQRIDEIINQIKSHDPDITCKGLFSIKGFEIFESLEYEDEEKRIQIERTEAVKEILKTKGVEGIVSLSSEVQFPNYLGHSLGSLDEGYSELLLPSMMDSMTDEFLTGYIRGTLLKEGMDWEVFSRIDSWDQEKYIRFLYSIPYTSEIFSRASNLTGKDSETYWKNVKINPWSVGDEYPVVVKSLIKVGRINNSVDVLHSIIHREDKNNFEIDTNIIIEALESLVALKEEAESLNEDHVLKLIKRVQDDDSIHVQDKLRIECMYLSILDGFYGLRPIVSEMQLAQDPEFFCDLIKLIYKSDRDEKLEVSSEQASVALQVYQLLEIWNIPPGGEANSFDAKKFEEWFKTMKKNVEESGHLNVAMITLGKVLINIPKDETGFWINKDIARILNEESSDKLREGLSSGFINSTGVYTPGIGFEEEMAHKFFEMATATEDIGYRRLANCLKEIWGYYVSLKNQYLSQETKFENKMII